jgi:hypothetical protein
MTVLTGVLSPSRDKVVVEVFELRRFESFAAIGDFPLISAVRPFWRVLKLAGDLFIDDRYGMAADTIPLLGFFYRRFVARLLS